MNTFVRMCEVWLKFSDVPFEIVMKAPDAHVIWSPTFEILFRESTVTPLQWSNSAMIFNKKKL